MDKKYKAIKTLKELDLSRSARSSLSSASGKSDFSTQSKEDKFNKAYAKDFSITPPRTPVKKDTLRPKTANPKMLNELKKKPDNGAEKILNPLTGKKVGLDYYKRLVKSGKITNEKPHLCFEDFYNELLETMKKYLTGKHPHHVSGEQHKNGRTLRETIKNAYEKEPNNWEYMKKEILKLYAKWDELVKDKEMAGFDIPTPYLRAVLIKYGYFDKDLIPVS